MIQATLLFVTGVLLLQMQPLLPPMVSLALLPLSALIGWRFRTGRWLRLAASLACGFLWAATVAQITLQSRLPGEFEAVELTVSGVVDSLPDVAPRRTRFRFLIDHYTANGETVAVSLPVLLSWYRTAPELGVGERWQLRVKLKRPHGMANPGGSDYERVLYQQGHRATGYVRKAVGNHRISPATGYRFDRTRQHIRQRIDTVVEAGVVRGILRALVIGDRSAIPSDAWEVFRRTGTNHLMAISGLHIGIVSGLFFFLGSWLWRRAGRLCLILPAQQAGAVIALIAAFGYAGLAGFAIPCVRALIMLSVVLGAVLSRRAVRPGRALAWALLLVVITDPLAVISAGFWLSFAAVTAILLGITGRLTLLSGWKWDLMRTQWLVTLGLAPILLILGFQVPLLAPLVNLLMVPLFSLVLVPLVLVALLMLYLFAPLGIPLLYLASWLIKQGYWLLSTIAEQHWSLGVPGAPTWTLLAALCGILLLFLPRGIPGRWSALVLLAPLVLFDVPHPARGELWVTMLDVGQGLAVVLETTEHRLLYDAGPRYPSGFDTGKTVVVPYLQSRGINHLDRIIVSNGDMDHRGGLSAVLGAVSHGGVLSGEPDRFSTGDPKPCLAGTHWQWDGVRFEILHPDRPGHWRGNNASCVLSVRSGENHLLLTGDIEAAAEAHLMARYGEQLAARVVTVPHHGSASSSGDGFIAATGARYGLVSAGYRNHYGFPNGAVMKRWRDAGTLLINTADTGAISLRVNPRGTVQRPLGYRQQTGKYWMDRHPEGGNRLTAFD